MSSPESRSPGVPGGVGARSPARILGLLFVQFRNQVLTARFKRRSRSKVFSECFPQGATYN
eukprot:461269-Prorocentrum_minimum.AAC.2